MGLWREREREREEITEGFKFGINQIEIGACVLWWPYLFYCSLVILSTLVNSYGTQRIWPMTQQFSQLRQ